MGKLTLDDISDLRAYERERDEFRKFIIALKKKRRVHVGPFVTLVFENRDTVRFQIQEMARAEKLSTDEAIEGELRVYNPLVPEPGRLAATLFIELTNEPDLREWLPKLVGIERSIVIRIGQGETSTDVRCLPNPEHEAMLTREEVTASVHYVHFELTSTQAERFAVEPIFLVVDHPDYRHETLLAPDTVAELVADLSGQKT